MEKTKTDFLATLNAPQREAAAHVEGPLLILAGAGSGKTRVITQRVAHLISSCGVWPEQILAVTFTNKAAREMRERVDQLLGGEGLREAAGRVTISTFHALGARLLRRHADKLKLRWSFSILDDVDQLRVIKELVRLREPGDDVDITARARKLRHFIERMKNQGWTPAQAHERAFSGDDEENAFFYEAYQERLRQQNSLDFGDLILGVLEVFRAHPQLAASYSNQWRQVMVDEFQDTNPAQYELLRHLTSRHANLTVVGDDDQAIYRWRGATIANIMGFEGAYPQTRVVKLEQNYRSTQIILDAADDVIRRNPGRHDKKLWTEREGGDKIVAFTGADDREEAVYVATQLQRLMHQGHSLRDCAVFFRTNAQARQFEEQLRYAGLSYQLIGGTSFYQREEIKDLLAYLRVALNPESQIDVSRVINTPSRGVGAGTLEKLQDAAEIPGVDTLFNAVRFVLGEDMTFEGELTLLEPNPKTPEHDSALAALERIRSAQLDGIRDFHQAIQTLRDDLLHFDRLAEVLRQFIERIHYMEHLASRFRDDAEDRAHNVGELINAIEDFEETFDPEQAKDLMLAPDVAPMLHTSAMSDASAALKLRAFLDQSALLQRVEQDEESAKAPGGAVTLMTVHGAKGLEFDNVFLVGMEDSMFPSIRDQHDPEEEREERRLAYVAITRARWRLYITNARRRRVYGQYKDNIPSRFLLEIDPERLTLDPRSVVKKINWAPPRRAINPWQYNANQEDDGAMQEAAQQLAGMPAAVAAGVPMAIPPRLRRAQAAPREESYAQAQPDYEDFSQAPSDDGWDAPTAAPIASKRAAASSDEIAPGHAVTHTRFGIGEVKQVSGAGDSAVVTVDFPMGGGVHKIVRKFLKVLG